MTGGEDSGSRESRYEQGFRLENPSADELAEALEAAVDYRGDVSIRLRDGSEVEGYIFNHGEHDGSTVLELFPRDASQRRSIPCADVQALWFSGKDTASGKSWENWVKRYNEKKAARERGEDVGRIGIDADPLED